MRKPRLFQKLLFVTALLISTMQLSAQQTFPENGVADPRHGHYAFTNATIVKDGSTTLTNATLVIKDGKIVAVGNNIKVPAGAVEIDCKGKYIYPSFIDIYADYGTSLPQAAGGQGGRGGGGGFFATQPQLETAVKGPYGWNQAIKSDADAYKVFTVDETKAKPLREAGFGTVLSHVRDGIARGSGAIVSLANEKENMVILKEKASAHYSFSKGTSSQSNPFCFVRTIRLLVNTCVDADEHYTM